MESVAKSPAASLSDQWYSGVTVRRKKLKLFRKGGCWSQISRAREPRPERRAQRAVPGGRDCDARCTDSGQSCGFQMVGLLTQSGGEVFG